MQPLCRFSGYPNYNRNAHRHSILTYHSMSLELRVSVKDTVCRRVVSRRIHSIGTSLVERSLWGHISCSSVCFLLMIFPYWEPHIPRLSTCDGDHFVQIERCIIRCGVEFREFRTMPRSGFFQDGKLKAREGMKDFATEH
jgi:hypothetical protein